MPMPVPTVPLDKLLPESAFAPLAELMNRHAPIAEFKALCAQHTAHLQARGVLPDYLAWMLYARALDVAATWSTKSKRR
jgi:hypothetical protein